MMTPLRQGMIEEMEIGNHSSNAMQDYVFDVAQFAKHVTKSPDLPDPEEIPLSAPGAALRRAGAQHAVKHVGRHTRRGAPAGDGTHLR